MMRLGLALIITAGNLLAQYAGAAACGKCHPSEFNSHLKTGHAQALAHSTASQPGQWAFGAGHQATTFVSRLNDTDYLEHGATWYSATETFGITPGHQNSDGLRYRIFDPSAGILRCFACHSTGPVQIAGDGSIQPSELGVNCEVCHGPGAAHAANPRTSHPRNPGRMTGSQMNTFCGECHRVQSSAEDGSNLLDPWNSRHQPLLLAASVCFLKSGDKLSCITCHAPHQPVDVKQSAYNPACLKCHAKVQHRISIANRPCTECHMPSVRINEYLAFANHRIGVYRPDDPLSPLPASSFTSGQAEIRVPAQVPRAVAPSHEAKQ